MNLSVLGDPISEWVQSVLVGLVKGDIDKLERKFDACRVTGYRIGDKQIRFDVIEL